MITRVLAALIFQFSLIIEETIGEEVDRKKENLYFITGGKINIKSNFSERVIIDLSDEFINSKQITSSIEGVKEDDNFKQEVEITQNQAFENRVDKFLDVKKIEDGKNKILSYILDEYGDNKIFELAMYINTVEGKKSIPKIEEKVVNLPDNVVSDSKESKIELRPNSFTIKYLKSENIYVELFKSVDPNNPKIEKCLFRFTVMKTATTPVIYRQLLIHEFLKKDKNEIIDYNFEILPLASFNEDDRQFMIYRRNNESIWLITCKNGASKSTVLKLQNSKLNFKILEAKYIQSKFILFTQFLKKQESTVDEYMNYYSIAPLGEELNLEKMIVRNLTRGKFLCAYFNPETDVALLDFIMPDLDKKVDETLITSYYYSKTAKMFDVYVEEYTINAKGLLIDPKTYRRHVSNKFVFQIFKKMKKDGKIIDPNFYLLVESRYSGKGVKVIKLGNVEVYFSKVLMNTNTILVKLKGSTNGNMFVYVAQEPKMLVKFVRNQKKMKTEDKRMLEDDVDIGYHQSRISVPGEIYSLDQYRFSSEGEQKNIFRILEEGKKMESFTVKVKGTFNSGVNGENVPSVEKSYKFFKISQEPKFKSFADEKTWDLKNEHPNGVNFKSHQEELIRGSFIEVGRRKKLDDLKKFHLSTTKEKADYTSLDKIDFNLIQKKFYQVKKKGKIVDEKKPFDIYRAGSRKTEKHSQANLRGREFMVSHEGGDISMPVFFEVQREDTISRSLIIDSKSKTAFYKANNSQFNFYNLAADSRNITSVELLDSNDAMLNISKNIFSLNIEDLIERPLTGIGSFCKAVTRIRMGTLPEIFMCFGQDMIQAHYVEERYNAIQTQIRIKYEKRELDEIMKDNELFKIIYSNRFTNVAVMVMKNKEKKEKSKLKLIFLHFYLTTNLHIKIGFPKYIDRFDFKEDELKFIDFFGDDLIIVKQKKEVIDLKKKDEDKEKPQPIFLVYKMTMYRDNKQLFNEDIDIKLVREIDLKDYFVKNEVSLKILKFEYISLLDRDPSSESFTKEQKFIKRLAFLLELDFNKQCSSDNNGKSTNPKIQKLMKFAQSELKLDSNEFCNTVQSTRSKYQNVIIFRHDLPAMEAFQPVFSSNQCLEMYMGPGLISKGNTYERSLSFMCLKKEDNKDISKDKKKNYRIYLLDSIQLMVSFNSVFHPRDYFKIPKANSEEEKKLGKDNSTLIEQLEFYSTSQIYERNLKANLIEKSKGDVNYREVQGYTTRSDNNEVEIKKMREFDLENLDWVIRKIGFQKSYLYFKDRELKDKKKEIDLTVESRLEDFSPFSSVVKKREYLDIRNFFEGHIFNSFVDCESHIECRDKTINATTQVKYKNQEFVSKVKSYEKLHLAKVNLSKSEKLWVLISDSDFVTKNNKGNLFKANIENLVKNCSGFGIYKNFTITLCNYQGKENFFRVFELPGMVWFDIKVSMVSKRVYNPRNMRVDFFGEYLVLKNYNEVYNKYHTVLVFKIVDGIIKGLKGENLTFFNHYQEKFKLSPVLELAMNDDHFNSMIIRNVNKGKEAKIDKILFVAVRRRATDQLILRFDSFNLKQTFDPKTNITTHSIEKTCDDKRLNIMFKVRKEDSYLIENAKLVDVPFDTSHKDLYFDFILHLANAHDYFFRVPIKDQIENDQINNVDIEKVKYLTISNPFFGLEGNDVKDPMPIFHNDTYIVLTNFADNEAYMTSYVIKNADRAKATDGTKGMKLFGFKNYKNFVYTFMTKKFDSGCYKMSLIEDKNDYMVNKDQTKKPQPKRILLDQQQSKIKERISLLLYNQNNEAFQISISNFVKVEIKNRYLASKSLEIFSEGANKKREFKLKVISSPLSFPLDYLACTVQIIIVLITGLGIVWILTICRKRQVSEETSEIELDDIDIAKENLINKTGDKEEVSRISLKGDVSNFELDLSNIGSYQNGEELNSVISHDNSSYSEEADDIVDLMPTRRGTNDSVIQSAILKNNEEKEKSRFAKYDNKRNLSEDEDDSFQVPAKDDSYEDYGEKNFDDSLDEKDEAVKRQKTYNPMGESSLFFNNVNFIPTEKQSRVKKTDKIYGDSKGEDEIKPAMIDSD